MEQHAAEPTTQSRADAPPGGCWDVVIVGAGPAGSVAAISVLRHAPGTRVLLLDRADFPRDKTCGDGIAPQAMDVLESLGVAGVTDGWTPLRDLDLCRGDNHVAGRLARPVWVIPRQVFDARLVDQAVAAGASLVRHRVRQVRSADGAVAIDGAFSAGIVVGADGAHSVVRRSIGARLLGSRALAIRGYAPTPPAIRGRQLIRYGARSQPSYAWAFDRGDGLSNVGYGELERPGSAQAAASASGLTRELLLDQLDQLIPGVAGSGSAWRAHHLPLSALGRGAEQPDGGVLLVGDAAGLVNPMSGEGIYYAVATGALAGRVAASVLRDHGSAEADAGARYRSGLRSLLGRHLTHTWVASQLTRRPEVIDAGIRAAARSQPVFDELVDLALGDGLIGRRLIGGLGRAFVSDWRGRAVAWSGVRPGRRAA